MLVAGMVFAALAAVLHLYIFVLESLRWTAPRTRATFGTTPEEAETTKLLAVNQGFYNLFLAIVRQSVSSPSRSVRLRSGRR